MKTQGFEPRFSQNLAPVGAKQDPKTLTSSIFHHYSASPKYIHNLYFLIAEPTEEQYLLIQVLDTLADPSANLT